MFHQRIWKAGKLESQKGRSQLLCTIFPFSRFNFNNSKPMKLTKAVLLDFSRALQFWQLLTAVMFYMKEYVSFKKATLCYCL